MTMTDADRIADRDDLAEMVERKEQRIRELEALNAEMLTALRDAEWFLAGIAPKECAFEVLCTRQDCQEGGCVAEKLRVVRAAISKAEGR